MATSLTGVNMLVDHEEGLHLSSCNREPSKCLCTFVSWIWASKPNHPDSVRSGKCMDNLLICFLCVMLKNYLHYFSTGKWMLFPSSQYVDETWNKVKTLLAAGKLGIKLNNNPIICCHPVIFSHLAYLVIYVLNRKYCQSCPSCSLH